jgi:hypothetical protein
MLIVLLLGGFEAGHFVWTQHKLVEAVRDGARFASRLPPYQLCDGDSLKSGAEADAAIASVKLLTRTGQVTNPSTDDDCTGSGGAKPKVCGWTDAQVELECGTFSTDGMYRSYEAAGPVIKVKATGVQYPSLFHGLGIDIFGDIKLSAESNAPVIGI